MFGLDQGERHENTALDRMSDAILSAVVLISVAFLIFAFFIDPQSRVVVVHVFAMFLAAELALLTADALSVPGSFTFFGILVFVWVIHRSRR